MSLSNVAILYHNYYDLAGIDEVRQRIKQLPGAKARLFCSLPDKFAKTMPPQRENEKFVVAGNVGKDIGGKLILIDLLLQLSPDVEYVALLHDKRSYQKHSGAYEKDNLFSILNRDKFQKIEEAFEQDKMLGIACASGSICNEYAGSGKFNSKNSTLLTELITKYGIHTNDYRFAAGTMFWIRTKLLKNFFSIHPALAIRGTLEEGNVLDHDKGTVTHCWERLLSWISLSAGYKLKEF